MGIAVVLQVGDPATLVPVGTASATAPSMSAESRMPDSSAHGVATIRSSNAWAPSADCSMEARIQWPLRFCSVQNSRIRVTSLIVPVRLR
jgi:hypothetical protein